MLIHDIRDVCRSLAQGWQSEGWGWGNRLDVGDFTVFVSPQGLTGTSFIQVSVMPKNAPSGMAVPFFRELDRFGDELDQRGRVTHREMHPRQWLTQNIQEAIAWADSSTRSIPPVSTPLDTVTRHHPPTEKDGMPESSES